MSHRRKFFVSTVFAVAFFALPRPTQVQAQAKEAHPAYQVVLSYLTYAMGQDWEKSAALIDKDSLIGLRDRYTDRISNARTLGEELEMCRRLECSNIDEAKALDPTTFYIRYHKAVQERFPVTKEKLDAILKTKEINLISLGEETFDGNKFAHALVRTRHQNGGKLIASLELISLLSVDGRWMVTLDALRPTIAPAPGSDPDGTKK